MIYRLKSKPEKVYCFDSSQLFCMLLFPPEYRAKVPLEKELPTS